MRLLYLLILSLPIFVYSADNNLDGKMNRACSVDIISPFFQKSFKTDSVFIARALSSINPECQNNVEYCEMLNEVIYGVLTTHPSETIRILTLSSVATLEFVKFQIENPVNDIIDIKIVLNSLKNTKIDSIIKEELIYSLKKALSKN